MTKQSRLKWLLLIERFHSRDQPTCWITKTKESISIKKIEFNSRSFSLVHHHGRHFFVLARKVYLKIKPLVTVKDYVFANVGRVALIFEQT